MEQPSTHTTTAPTVRQTFQYRLHPPPERERALAPVLWRCRTLYNCAVEQRLTGWRRGQGQSATRCQQEAERKEGRAIFREDAALHSQVWHDGLARLEQASQAGFRRVAA